MRLLPRAETAGQAWIQPYNGPGSGDDYALAAVVDDGNNVVVTGKSISSRSGYDYATIPYPSAGVPLWTNRYNAPGTSTNAGR